MYYLTKFCRICVNSDEKLLDIDAKDYDLVRFSDKLEICTKMVITKEDLSTLICMSCVKKLRTSYQFHSMCMKSDDILKGYLSELLNSKDYNQETFINSELRVSITPVPQIKQEKLDNLYTLFNNNNDDGDIDPQEEKPRLPEKVIGHKVKKKRVSKGQRCSLLKKLLSTVANPPKSEHTKTSKSSPSPSNNKPPKKKAGGLKDLLVFIKDYDFGYKIYDSMTEVHETTPLDKLEDFSKTFFYSDFTDYRNTILSVINEHHLETSDEDDMFNSFDEEEDNKLWRPELKKEYVEEEVVVEPDIKIKTEMNEMDYENEYLPSEFVQTCYDEDTPQVAETSKQKEFIDFETYLANKNGNSSRSSDAASTYQAARDAGEFQFPNSVINNKLSSMAPSNIDLLQQFTNRTKGKSISRNSLKCRTRGQPFINPQLMEQFILRSFRCDKCNRCFKSPGYLHSHCTKMGH